VFTVVLTVLCIAVCVSKVHSFKHLLLSEVCGVFDSESETEFTSFLLSGKILCRILKIVV
jgi:hypothetical protein